MKIVVTGASGNIGTSLVEELVRTMDDLVTAGKILHWGVSCWTAAQIEDACRIARETGREPPISNQPPYNMIERDVEAEVIPACRELGLSQVVFSPLAQGVLTGKYKDGKRPAGTRAADKGTAFWMDKHFAPATLAAVERARQAAERAGATLSATALRWCLRDQNVASVIVGVTSVAQIEQNVAAAAAEIPESVIESVAEALGGAR